MTELTFLPFAMPFLDQSEISEVVESLHSGWITSGPKCRAFEEKVDGGCRLRQGGKRVRAVTPVHFAGLACDMDRINALAENYGLAVIEDAAHAFPTRYKGKLVGTLSPLTVFSFYATKTITTGEGGMVLTDNDEFADRMRIMRLHGISKDAWKRYTAEGSWYYEIVAPGYKYNMTDIAAAMGLHQLDKAEWMWQVRKRYAERYTEAFSAYPGLEVPYAGTTEDQHAWHLYVLRLRPERLKISRNQMIEVLKNLGIGTSVHFIPLHLHPYYRDLYGFKAGDFPVSEDLYERSISLPIYPKMTEADLERVITAVTTLVKQHRV